MAETDNREGIGVGVGGSDSIRLHSNKLTRVIFKSRLHLRLNVKRDNLGYQAQLCAAKEFVDIKLHEIYYSKLTEASHTSVSALDIIGSVNGLPSTEHVILPRNLLQTSARTPRKTYDRPSVRAGNK